MRSGTNNKHNKLFLMNRVDDAILVGKANRVISLQFADQRFACMRIDSDSAAKNSP